MRGGYSYPFYYPNIVSRDELSDSHRWSGLDQGTMSPLFQGDKLMIPILIELREAFLSSRSFGPS